MSQKTAKKQRSNAARVAPHRPPRSSNRGLWVAGGSVAVVVAAVIVLIVARAGGGSPATPAAGGQQGSTPAPAAVVKAVTTITAAQFDRIGRGTVLGQPIAIKGKPLSQSGRPLVVYVGAEYCPYCAAQRWAVVAALARFGTFTNLGATHSSTVDVYPDTRTFSFHGASYTSSYISFSPVETQSNLVVGNHYANLDAPTALQQRLIETYDVPPYVSAANTGAIPFIDFGNRYVTIGAQYRPEVLQGLTMQQIAAALRDPTSAVATSVLGAANSISATICRLTGSRPASVCSSSGVSAYAHG